eukprot:s114_g27.t1
MGFLRYMECLALTFLGSAPFLALVTYKLDPMTDFDACAKPCYNIQYFRTKTMPEITAAHLQLNPSVLPWDVPIFVAVENGRNFSAVPPQLTWWGFLQTYHPILGWIWEASETRELPNPAHVNEFACGSESVRKQIENHTNEGCGITVYIFALIMWTIIKIGHDWALLAGVPEQITLPISFLSWMFQLLASCAAFSWAAAATEVFVSRVPERNSACYFQLAPFATLTALGVPLLLLHFAHAKMNSLVLSLVHGDYLYCKISHVPYLAVKGTAAPHFLLTNGLHGDSDVLPAPHQQLQCRNRKQLAIFVRGLLYVYWVLLFGFIIPFASGNIFHHVTEMAVSHDWSVGPVAFLKLATLLAAASTPVVGSALAAWMFLAMMQEVFSEWNGLRAIEKISLFSQLTLYIAVFMLALSTFGGAWNIVQAVIFHSGAGGLQQHWEWYLHMKATVVLGCFVFAFGVDEPLERLLSPGLMGIAARG